VLVHEATTIVDAENDGALEPGESFELGEQLRNAGNATATGVSGSISGPGLTFSQGSSTWPNLAPGGVGTNNPTFAGALSAGASCGADVTATLSLTAQGQSVPITLPTGESQPPTLATRAHSPPVAIPDDSAVGVTSTLAVTSPGRIKDLDVRIDSITHPFVGDLRIDLSGPDGTTVTLAEHPGGPDNAGRDFAGTVFDDEAATDISAAAAPYTGSFRPQNDQLSRFDGKQRDGTWTLRVRDLGEFATGTLGGWGTRTRIAGCDAGGTGPDTTINPPTPSNPSASREATFRFESTAPAARFECRLDSSDYVECASPHTYSGLRDGSHTVSVRAIDGTGNVDTSLDSHTWTVDAPPDTSIQTWTVRAEQSDAAGNSGASAPVTFRVDPIPPGFALAPAEENLAGALGRGVPIFAGCASACRVSATLSLSAAKARALGLRAGRWSLGALAATLARGAARTFALRPSPAARRALRRLESLRVRLSVDVHGGGARVRLRQAVRLTRTAGLRRIARRGLPLRAACSESCTMSARLALPAPNARRLGLRAPRGAPLTVARETVRASLAPSRLLLAVDRRYRRALRRARRGSKAILEALVQGSTGPRQRLNRRVTLQR
jgi:subtilisin-like proprotein convertase family protein